MPKTTRVLHDDHEFLVVDERRLGQPRAITLLVRTDDAAFAGAAADAVVQTTLGKWTPLGMWEDDASHPFTEGGLKWVPTMNAVATRYLADADTIKAANTTYYCVTVHAQIGFSLTSAQPDGLTARVFRREDAARAALSELADDGSAAVVAINDLYDFLFRLAEQGFAGAVLDDAEPVYFCADAQSRPQFLRLTPGEENDVEQWLLNPNGTWTEYEGDLELELFRDQDACDRNMTENLGQVPFFGYAPGLPFFAVFRKGELDTPLQVSDTEAAGEGENTAAAASVVPIFADVTAAEEFLASHELVDHELRPLADLHGFIARAEHDGQRVILQPEAHRARGAALWTRGAEIILDSFSGFWSSIDRGAHFTLVES